MIDAAFERGQAEHCVQAYRLHADRQGNTRLPRFRAEDGPRCGRMFARTSPKKRPRDPRRPQK
eukprot:7913796-Pyramimonas_sp.AAC.1